MRFQTLRRVLRDHGIDRTALIVGLAALALYSLAATWGLPQATNPIQIRGWDVDGVAGIRVLSEFHNLLVEPKPDWYTAYPLLHYLVLGALYAPYLGFLMVTGTFSAPSADYPFGFSDPVAPLAAMALIARVVTVMMAAGTVMIIYAGAASLWDRRAGIVSALVLGLSTPMVYYARTSNLDVPVLFWTALGILVVLHTLRGRLTVGRAIAIGVISALAVGTKDQVYGAWLPAIGIVLVHHLQMVRRGEERRPLLSPLVLIGTGIVTYAAANGVFVRPSRFVRHLGFITSFEETFPNLLNDNGLTIVRPASATGYASLVGDLMGATAVGMTPLLLIAGLAGAVVAWRSRPTARVLAWMGVGFMVLTLFPLHHIQYRYTLLPILLMAITVGGLVTERGGLPRAARLVASVVIGVGLLWQAAVSVDLTYQMRSDARYAASTWLDEELAAGDSIGFFGAMHQLPYIPAGVHLVPLLGGPPEDDRDPSAWTEYVLVAPDYYSDERRERSGLLPVELYDGLLDGSLGYERLALFRTEPLTGRPVAYLPYVNPQVQVFKREPIS